MIKNAKFTETITVVRGSATVGSSSDGSVILGTTSTFQCLGSIQPLSGFEQVSLPEFDRSKEWLWCYCDTQLNTVSTSPSVPADLITRADGTVYKVTRCQPWNSSGLSIGPYWQALICLNNP